MARTIVLIADLLFGSRVQENLRAAGHEVQLAGDRDALVGRLERCEVLVVDLADERLGGLEAVRALGATGEDGCRHPRTLGFYPHVDTETRERAQQAGFDLVVPRSRMAREGGGLVARLALGR